MMTLLAFIVTIGLLVAIHEYGHFQVARWCNVKVLRFSIGFGKPLWQKTFGQDKTEFVLAAIPLGGFVKMLDERELKVEQEENPQLTQPNYSDADLKRAFNRQTVWKRIAIVLAGPLANLLLAIVLYWVLFMLGVAGTRPIIGEVTANSLAAQASMAAGETIQKINGEPVSSWQEARWILLEASLESKSVEIDAVNQNNELFQHTLSFTGLDPNSDANQDVEVDVLKKMGLTEFRPNIAAVIGEILPSSVAEKSGFLVKDKILSIDGVPIYDWEQVVNTVKNNPNKKLWFEIERAKKTLRIAAAPEVIQDNGQTIGRMGASVKIDQAELDKMLVTFSYSPLASLQKAILKTWDTSIFSLKMLGKMLIGQVSLKSISGPVTIADYAGKSANLGLKTFLSFLALVSISIGVLNLLPIPVLDGGHLMYYIVEIFKGSAVSEKAMLIGQKFGIAVLGSLMIVALLNDFHRLLS